MTDKDMFQLIELHKQAQAKADEHYLNCEQCQKYTYDLDAVKCDAGIELDREVEKAETKIEDYRIDIY